MVDNHRCNPWFYDKYESHAYVCISQYRLQSYTEFETLPDDVYKPMYIVTSSLDLVSNLVRYLPNKSKAYPSLPIVSSSSRNSQSLTLSVDSVIRGLTPSDNSPFFLRIPFSPITVVYPSYQRTPSYPQIAGHFPRSSVGAQPTQAEAASCNHQYSLRFIY